MANKIVLISEDSDFFDYIKLKIELRKSDELFMYSFDEVPDKLQFLMSCVLIVNSEGRQEKTLELIRLLKGTPIVIMAFNEDSIFKKKCYREGMFDFMPILTPDAEFRARILPLLSVATLLEKNKQYRDILVNKNILNVNNEVFIDYKSTIENALIKIKNSSQKAVLVALSPDEKSKFLMQQNVIESVILNNIRRNDILMNYAPNKYFLILHDIDVKSAQKLWSKINEQFSLPIYASFTTITDKSSEHLIDTALNKLTDTITKKKHSNNISEKPKTNILESLKNDNTSIQNFKLFRQEFGQKLEQIISPVFYQIQQKYSGKLIGLKLEQDSKNGFGTFNIKGKHFSAYFRITCPGFSKINIDISLQHEKGNIDTKRITLNPTELEQGMLEDLLEQFITETKKYNI